jgi:hypothetical protein
MKTKVVCVLILFTSLLLATSCCPCRKLSDKSEHLIKDSVYTKFETKWRDTVITTPVDSASIMAMVICPPSGVINTPTFTKTNKNATVTAAIKNNVLVADCKCDGLELRLKLRDTTIEKYKLAVDHYKKQTVIREKYIPKWVKILAVIGVCLMLFEIAKLIFKLYKTFM